MSSKPSRAPTKPGARLESIDLLRGIVILLMTLDHVRDFVSIDRFDFSDPTLTTGIHYTTRWITHVCAPTFVFLAGTSALLSSKGRSKRRLSGHLVKRGVWLIIAEVTFVAFAWWLSPPQRVTLQVIWAIGVSMLVLAVLVRLPRRISVAFGAIVVGGHNSLDGITVVGDGVAADVWRILHQPDAFEAAGQTIVPLYPLLPWVGVMALGYGLAPLIRDSAPKTFRVGLALTFLFVALRLIDVYGEPSARVATPDAAVALMSFLDTTKYPPSLLFLLMTLGPALMFLGTVRTAPRALRFMLTFGRVPFFYYLAHLYLGHALAVAIGLAQGFGAAETMTAFSEYPADFGVPLWGVYVVSVIVAVTLYPACRWFAAIKATGRYPVLSYL